MNPFYNDERISAYIDGELSGDEHARFEERLGHDAELRQVVDELRALRSDLELLPRHALERDFAQRVLRQAEREVLASGINGAARDAETADPSPGQASSAPITPSTLAGGDLIPAWSSNWSRERLIRPALWAGLAIATAIMLMIFNREPRDHGPEIAKLDKEQLKQKTELGDMEKKSSVAVSRDAAETRRPEEDRLRENKQSVDTLDIAKGEGRGAGRLNRPALAAVERSETARKEPELESPPDPARLASRDGRQDLARQDEAGGGKSSGTSGALAKSMEKPVTPESDKRGLAQDVKKKIALFAEQGASGAAGSAVGGAKDSQTPTEKSIQERNRNLADGRRPSAAPDRAPAAPGAIATSRDELAAKRGGLAGPATGGYGAGLKPNSAPEGLGLDATLFSSPNGSSAPAGIIVAECVSADGATDAAFQQLLAKNHIVFDNSFAFSDDPSATQMPRSVATDGETIEFDRFSKSGGAERPSAPNRGAVALKGASAPADQAQKIAGVAAPQERPALAPQPIRSPLVATSARRESLGKNETAARRADADEVEVVYVEGSRAQVLGLVADVRSRPGVFHQFVVATTPATEFGSSASRFYAEDQDSKRPDIAQRQIATDEPTPTMAPVILDRPSGKLDEKQADAKFAAAKIGSKIDGSKTESVKTDGVTTDDDAQQVYRFKAKGPEAGDPKADAAKWVEQTETKNSPAKAPAIQTTIIQTPALQSSDKPLKAISSDVKSGESKHTEVKLAGPQILNRPTDALIERSPAPIEAPPAASSVGTAWRLRALPENLSDAMLPQLGKPQQNSIEATAPFDFAPAGADSVAGQPSIDRGSDAKSTPARAPKQPPVAKVLALPAASPEHSAPAAPERNGEELSDLPSTMPAKTAAVANVDSTNKDIALGGDKSGGKAPAHSDSSTNGVAERSSMGRAPEPRMRAVFLFRRAMAPVAAAAPVDAKPTADTESSKALPPASAGKESAPPLREPANSPSPAKH